MPKKYIDFDAMWAEAQSEPITFRALGKEYTIPGDTPAGPLLKIQEIQEKYPDGNIPQDELMSIMMSVLDKSIIDELTAKGLTAKQLVQVLQGVLDAYREAADPNSTTPTEMETPVAIPQTARKRKRRGHR